MNQNVFILSCSISANVRQSTQIKMEDLKLPDEVIETLQKQQSMSVRPQLSSSLKNYLSELRLEQRRLYEEYCIHNGDTHFLCASDFEDAMDVINTIRRKASEFNALLRNMWSDECQKWEETVSRFVDPIFEDPEQRAIVRGAYQSLFPTRDEFQSPIDVYVVGPYPVSMEVAETADEGLNQKIAETAAFNTSEVYKAAQESAADRAYQKCAELLDDLDVRHSSKVTERQTGSTKRRGSWEIAAQELALISQHVPGLEKAKKLANELLEVGKQMKVVLDAKKRQLYFDRYNTIKVEMRQEFQNIVDRRYSSEGVDALKKSLALSGRYKDLINAANQAQDVEQLADVMKDVDTETSVLSARIKQLQRVVQQRKEFLSASTVSRDDLVAAVQEITKEDEIDF